SRRLDDGTAEEVTVLEGGVAGRDADANAQLLRCASVVSGNGLLHHGGRAEGVGRAVEGNHEAVADVLDHLTAGGRGGVRQQLEMGAPEAVAGVGPET